MSNQNASRPAAGGTHRELVTATPATSTALGTLRDWLEQADRSPYLASNKEDRLRQLVRALAPEDFPRAWALHVHSHELQNKLRNLVVTRWASADPQAALSALQGISDRRARHDLLDSAVSGWAGKDAAAAAAWVKSFYPQAEQASKLMLVFSACGLREPQAALALWQQMPPGVARDEASRTFIESLAHQDRNSAVPEWLARAPASPESLLSPP